MTPASRPQTPPHAGTHDPSSLAPPVTPTPKKRKAPKTRVKSAAPRPDPPHTRSKSKIIPAGSPSPALTALISATPAGPSSSLLPTHSLGSPTPPATPTAVDKGKGKAIPQDSDSHAGLSKIRTVQNCLRDLKNELHGIKGATEVWDGIWNQVHKLEDIVQGAKSARVTFSAVTAEELERVGVQRKCLIFEPPKVIELINALPTSAKTEIADLHARVKKIYAHVNMEYESGSRMVLDEILLTLAVIASSQTRGVAILPEMRITQRDGVCISHPVSGYKLWLSGIADYAVIEYEDVKDFKARLLGSRDDPFKSGISHGHLFLVEAKRQGPDLSSCVPEAVSQAIALLMSSNFPEVRVCLSDGQTWIFFLVKMVNETLTYYESAKRYLKRDVLEDSDLKLREIVQLV